jgi:Asp-tRNA(Asn)/Glu-tRNA(Gln) amidotransferase A subunit family amidase
MARSVHDLWILEGVLSQADTPEVIARLEARGTRPERVGILRGRFAEVASADCLDVFERAMSRLSRAGLATADCPLPASFDTVLENHRTVMLTEIAAGHAERFREGRMHYLPRMAALIEEGSQRRGVEYILARQHQRDFSRDMDRLLEDWEVLACPATPGGAPGPETTGDPTFNSPFSYCGLPAVTVPMGLDSDGLPLGLQLIGRRNGDRELLLAALWCEAVLGPVDSSRTG